MHLAFVSISQFYFIDWGIKKKNLPKRIQVSILTRVHYNARIEKRAQTRTPRNNTWNNIHFGKSEINVDRQIAQYFTLWVLHRMQSSHQPSATMKCNQYKKEIFVAQILFVLQLSFPLCINYKSSFPLRLYLILWWFFIHKIKNSAIQY